MTAAQAGAACGSSPLEPARSTGIDDLLAAGRQVPDQRALVADEGRVKTRRETALRRRRKGGADRPPLGAPLGQTAVEDRDVGVPEEAQHPPGAAGRRQADTVIND